MKRLFLAAVMVAIASIAGCTWYSAWFSAFGGAYTDSGPNFFDRSHHYDSKVDSYGLHQDSPEMTSTGPVQPPGSGYPEF